MPDSVTTTWRGIAMEDFLTGSSPAQITSVVLGVGATPLTPFVLASGDSGAAVAGVLVGEIYMNSAVIPNRLRTRMS